MSYYVLGSKNQAVFIMDRPELPGNLKFHRGIKEALDIPLIKFIMDKNNSQGELTDQLETALPGLTISKNFKNTLDKVGVDNIDYYQAMVSNEVTGEVFHDIYVANVIGLLTCMDMEKSEYEPYAGIPNKINEIGKLVLKENAIKDYKVFRMKEFSSIIIIDESVKNEIELAGITNTECIPIEEFDTYL